MPGSKFSKQVNTPKKERQWSSVYGSSTKASGASSGSAIRQANAAVKRGGKK